MFHCCINVQYLLNIIFQAVSILENNIHKIEMNMMEAEHMRKKYKAIRASLLDDSVLFESTLKKLEQNILKQETEIKHLQVNTCSNFNH